MDGVHDKNASYGEEVVCHDFHLRFFGLANSRAYFLSADGLVTYGVSLLIEWNESGIVDFYDGMSSVVNEGKLTGSGIRLAQEVHIA